MEPRSATCSVYPENFRYHAKCSQTLEQCNCYAEPARTALFTRVSFDYYASRYVRTRTRPLRARGCVRVCVRKLGVAWRQVYLSTPSSSYRGCASSARGTSPHTLRIYTDERTRILGSFYALSLFSLLLFFSSIFVAPRRRLPRPTRGSTPLFCRF